MMQLMISASVSTVAVIRPWQVTPIFLQDPRRYHVALCTCWPKKAAWG